MPVIDNFDIIFDAKTGKMRAELRSAESTAKRSSDNMSKSADKHTASIKRTTTAIRALRTGVVATAVVMAGRAAKSGLDYASSVQELHNKAQSVYQDSMPGVLKKWEEYHKLTGRNTDQTLAMSTSLQDLLVPLGFGRKAAADMSVDVAKLAVDVASFNNAVDSDVMNDFNKALTGSHETVQKYGIIINDTELKQEALRQGIKKSLKDMDAREKAELRLALIIRGTEDAQGDAIKTADDYANVQKKVSGALLDIVNVSFKEWLDDAADGGNALVTILENIAEAIERANEAARNAGTRGFLWAKPDRDLNDLEHIIGRMEYLQNIKDKPMSGLIAHNPDEYQRWYTQQQPGGELAFLNAAATHKRGQLFAGQENTQASDKASRAEKGLDAIDQPTTTESTSGPPPKTLEDYAIQDPYMIEEVEDGEERFIASLERAEVAAQEWQDTLAQLGDQIADQFVDNLIEGENFFEGFEEIGKDFVKTMIKQFIKLQAMNLIPGLGGVGAVAGGGAGGGGLGSIFSGLFGKASGGQGQKGHSYLFEANQQEVVTMGTGSRITPIKEYDQKRFGGGGAGVSIVNNNNFQMPDSGDPGTNAGEIVNQLEHQNLYSLRDAQRRGK